MVQGYYNLSEAAQVLGMSPDELRGMAQRNQIRSFQDRGTLRFRMQDVQELARRRGASSDPDLPLTAEPKSGPRTPAGPRSGAPKSGAPKSGGPKSPPRTPRPPGDAPEVFSFDLGADDQLAIGQEVLSDVGSKSGSRSGPKKTPSGSDSDVKLVSDKGPDSDVRLVGDTMGPRTPKVQRKSQLAPPPISPTPRKSSRIAGGAESVDSGVRLVPMDSDSDVKIVGAGSGDEIPLGTAPPPSAADSDIRLERVPEQPAPSSEEMMLTDEINLDEEIKKQEAAQRKQPKSRVRPKQEPKFPTESPFELSDTDLKATGSGAKRPSSSDFELTPKGVKDDSSDFDLTPARDSSVLEPDSGSDFSLELPDDAIDIGESGVQLTGPTSGISLSNPVDAGISLEDAGSDSMDIDLDVRGAEAQDSTDSSSEFELSLEDSGEGAAQSDSSEFELTLDDSGSEVPALGGLQAKAAEKDIFETEFEVPGLEDSGSEVAALETSDTDLESSDFDLALDDSDLAVEDESGSQVVALDEETADEAAETIAGELGEDLGVEEAEEEEEEEEEVSTGRVREVVRERIIEPAPWGALPVVFMLPCVIVMLVVGIMGFELVQSSAGFRSAGFLTKTMSKLVGQEIR